MIRIIALIFLFGLRMGSLHAQQNNSWIDYSKTYYKFRLGADSLCRIPQSVLAAAGLGAVNADHFRLWRNGSEVRLYTTATNAPLGPGGFIEFWGEANDGKPDKRLYRDPDFQLSDRYSLETDTVSYFLTVDPASTPLRYTDAVNTAPSSATPDPYFFRDVEYQYRTQLNRGEAKPVGEYVYSAAYDPAEGWSSAFTAPCCDLVKEFFDLNVYTAGPPNSLTVRVTAAGAAPNNRDLVIKLNQTEITAAPYSSSVNLPFFGYQRVEIGNLPLSLFQNPDYLPVYVNGNSANTFDRIVVASIGLTFPSAFRFTQARYFPFRLEPSAAGHYLVIEEFNYGAQPPVLYDLTSGRRYLGETASTPGRVKFVLPPSADTRRFILMSQESPCNITSMSTRNFTDITQSDNQANYILISHPALFDDGSGRNPVEEYRQYRSSAAGGGYNARVYDINELTDQFGFGITHHPDAIRDFLMYAHDRFVQRPEHVLIIGRGMNYIDQRTHESDPLANRLNRVTCFGWPPSDVLLASRPGTVVPVIPIGRVGAVDGEEVLLYLDKVREYESAQQTPSPSIAVKSWMKDMIHVVGGRDSLENQSFRSYMNGYKTIAEDSSFGGYVETFTKTSTGAVQQANSARIEQLFNQGLGWVGYFGHSSANTFEFNLSNPEIYQNAGKYPFFNVSGCSAGNFYVFDPLRLNGNLTLSEKYVLAAQRGSIGFLADTHFGIPPFLNFYNDALYKAVCRTLYGSTIGKQMVSVCQDLGGLNSGLDFFTRIHLEEINLHGDPAIRVNTFPKADFAIEEPQVRISPTIISVADNQFTVKVRMLNLGKAVGDSIVVSVVHRLPNDTVRVLTRRTLAAIRYADSLELTVPINPSVDKGLNRIIVTLDETQRIEEIFETNNTVTKEFYIFEDELRPVWPQPFAIVNRTGITFTASTANPLSGQRNYVMEVDTTSSFNSPFKKTYTQSGPGGVVSFTPANLSFTDSTVYYWRVAMVPTGSNPIIWNASSLVYLNNGGTGYNQSHYDQWQGSTFDNLQLDPDRVFRFRSQPRNLIIRTGLFPYFDYDRINVNLDFNQLELYGCIYNSLQFYVFDTATLLPWNNYNVSASQGRYGSFRVCRNTGITDTTRRFFEYPYNNFAYRKNAMDFIDSIPDGLFVAITNLGNKLSNSSFIDQWKADTAVLGSGRSLYHALQNIGFGAIDSFTRNRPFLYFFRKGRPNYSPTTVMGAEDSSYIDQTFNLNSISTEGRIVSPVFGPAAEWTSLRWRGSSSDPLPADTVRVGVWGIRPDGSRQALAQVYPAQDTSLAFVDANQYPRIQLETSVTDTRYITPQQLRYLRLQARPVPEGALAPALRFSCPDTVEQGQPLNIEIAFQNISDQPFDSLLKVKLVVTDRNNVSTLIDLPRRKALVVGDTLVVSYVLPTRDLSGTNTLLVDVNPDEDQPELYHFNNILYKSFHVRADRYHPLLDVTFDGVHILNRDLVSARPEILVQLRDESRYLELSDTASLQLKVRFPDQSIRTYSFGDTMRFIPADLSTGENKARIEFRPSFPDDGEYELIVSGKDAVGNTAGALDYSVVFQVINKPMISNLLNYPNPFTTSTAFVFTLTGSELPQNMRIQILTVTGKVVREITQQELGPIHIGRNVTEFKWDGTDRYGQPLANGVYLYRVITNLNGKSLDRYRSDGEDTDRFFNKGYGKMVLIR